MADPSRTEYADTQALIAAEAPDYPSFIFSERELRKCAETFKSGFDGLVTYAVKANPEEHVVAILADAGLTAFDVASPAEMELVHRLAPQATLHYNNPVKSRREIIAAQDTYGVRSYAIDNLAELEQLADIVKPSRDVEITIRFKAGKARKAYDFGTKFGISENGAIELAKVADQLGYTVSLCFHVGSQCEESYAYERHIMAAGRIAKKSGISIARLNVGGGFPAAYPSSGAPPLDRYFEAIERALKKTFGGSRPEMIIEPGRAMVTPSTSLLLRVKHVRGGRNVYVNDGAYGALMEIKFMPIVPAVRVWRGDEILKDKARSCTLFGPTCDSYDMLDQPFDLPQSIQEDDYIEMSQMGAYTQASTTAFNGFATRMQYFADQILM